MVKELRSSIFKIALSEAQYIHFGKKVFILMDEYETLINNILQYDSFTKNIKKKV